MTRSSEPAWSIGADGWVSGIRQIPSPNRDRRPGDEPAELVVIHAISLPPGEYGGNAVVEFFTNRLKAGDHPYFEGIADRRVSAHFFIRRDGEVIQFVSCLERAWHAGVSCWQGRERCNDFSLGIELEGDDHTQFTAEQYRLLKYLLALLSRRFPIKAIVGHADIAAGRKTDPGPWFEWSQLA